MVKDDNSNSGWGRMVGFIMVGVGFLSVREIYRIKENKVSGMSLGELIGRWFLGIGKNYNRK